MMIVDDLISTVSRLSPRERVEMGRKAYKEIFEELSKDLGVKEKQIEKYIQLTVRAFVSADKVCDETEKDIFNAISGKHFTFDQFAEYSDLGSGAEFVEAYDQKVDSGSFKLKYATCVFGLCIMAHDGEVTASEKALLEKVMA